MACKIALIATKLIGFDLINVNLIPYDAISLVISRIINIYHIAPIFVSKKLAAILVLVSIEDTMVVPRSAHIIVAILHNFEFTFYVVLIMDVNLSLIACNLTVVMVIKLFFVKNVCIYNINGYFATYVIRSRFTSCESIKTMTIVPILIQFNWINLKTIELRDTQTIPLLDNIIYQISMIFLSTQSYI